MTAILPCSCYHEFQDKTYGKQNRVHNHALHGASKQGAWRCTVCGKEKPIKDV